MALCEQCGQQSATVHITRIANSATTVVHLCEICAKGKGFTVETGQDASLFLPEMTVALGPEEKGEDRKCIHCQCSLSEFKSTGLLGCAACYGEFEKEIDTVLTAKHGTVLHRGKRSAIHAECEDVNRLSLELADAVRREEYERAAVLRDKINRVNQSGHSAR